MRSHSEMAVVKANWRRYFMDDQLFSPKCKPHGEEMCSTCVDMALHSIAEEYGWRERWYHTGDGGVEVLDTAEEAHEQRAMDARRLAELEAQRAELCDLLDRVMEHPLDWGDDRESAYLLSDINDAIAIQDELP